MHRRFYLLCAAASFVAYAAGLSGTAFGQRISVAEARALPLGSFAFVEATVVTAVDLVNSSASATLTLESGGAGVSLIAPQASLSPIAAGLQPGDLVQFEGTTESFNGLFQIRLVSPGDDLGLVANGLPPSPINVALADFQNGSAVAEAVESRIIRLFGVQFVGSGVFAGTTSYQVSNGVNSATMRVQTSALDFVGAPIPTGLVNIVGIASQFDGSNPGPGVPGAGYQILPLSISDITPVPEPTGSLCALIALVAGAMQHRVRSRR